MPFALSPRLFARHAFLLCASLVATTATLFAQFPSAADGFDADVDGNVYAVVQQADGKLLIGGQFSSVHGYPRSNLARINSDGSIDESFTANADGLVRAIVLQPDGRILVGGDFANIGAVARGRVARLNANGAVETSFNPNIGSALPPQVALQPEVHALLLQPDGRIVVGGAFGSVQPGGTGAAVTRNNVARFNADGTLDTSFNPNPDSTVLSLALHTGGKILIGGGFMALQPAGDASATTRHRIARLNPSGTVDSEFNPDANNGVTSIAVQRDGKILLGGFFTTLQPIGESGAANRVHIARLNADGSLDSEFFPRVDGNVAAIAVEPDGAILVGGSFTSVFGRGSVVGNLSYIARFNPDGSLDTNFSPRLNAAVDAFATSLDGKVIIGGHFTRAQPRSAVTALVRNHVARLNADGSFDTNFELDAGGRTLVSVTQSDGKVIIGGTFTNVGGTTHNYLARLNADGSVDATYNPDFDGRVYAMALQSDGKLLVGGAFTTIGNEPRNHIARLNPSGTIDSEFNPNIDGQVGVIVLQSDQRILVGGSFANVQPLGSSTATARANVLRLNANGTLDTAFDPSANSSVSSIAVQSDGKILLGGLFSTLTPGFAANTSATPTARNFFARLNTDGTIDTAFVPNPNGQVSTIAIQSDSKVIIGGAFTGLAPTGATALTVRNHIARLNADGTIDTPYDPNANGNVLVSALQTDGKLLIGGSFTTLQPGTEAVYTLRKYAARLNTDGTVDSTFNLDINEQPGNRVDSLRVQSDGRVFIGGSFASLQPAGSAARATRPGLVRLAANGAVDITFDPRAGGSTGAIVNGFAIQPDGKVIAVGSFADLGGAKSTNVARFLPEGTADANFGATLTTDGPVNAVAIRPNGAPVASQLAGLGWLNANGTLRPAFSPTTRLSGEIDAIAVQSNGSVLLGGAFANLSNTTAGNLVRFNAAGVIDTSFNPAPNGAITGIAVQADGRIIIVGAFSTVNGVARNRIARIDADGSVDVTFDPNASGRVHAVVIQSDGLIVIGGAFTTLTPNGTTTVVTRNYLARINVDGTVDSTYDPNANFTVNALALQADGKVVAGGAFTSLQPNGGTTAFNRNGVARINTDGTLDQNFDPNPNAAVNAIAALPNGQFVLGGVFTSLQQNTTGTLFTRNNIARINSDGAIDANFNPNANGAVNAVAVQADGAVVLSGAFTTLQAGNASSAVARHGLARVNADGSLDLNFNPDVNGTVSVILARPDGSVMIGGNFTGLQLNGSIVVGGSFASIGGIPARNLATLNEDGSVNTTFQPRPDGAVNAILIQPDGRMIAAGAFTNIAGATRARVARFNADGTLEAAFNPPAMVGTVNALALEADGRILVGGDITSVGGSASSAIVRLNRDGSLATAPAASALTVTGVTGLAVQPNGRILVLAAGSGVRSSLLRLNADLTQDTTFTPVNGGSELIRSFALQADGRILVGGAFTTIGGAPVARLARLNSNGTVDTGFNSAANGLVTAVALQPDGRAIVGGSFNNIGGQQRVGIARLGSAGIALQILGVAANRSAVIWNRAGAVGEISSVVFEQSLDRDTWTRLGEGTRVANSGADWQLTGVNLPASGVFYIRARAIAPTSAGKSSSLFESVREFNFANPLSASTGTIAQTIVPAQAAAPSLTFDPITGIAPRATITMVAGEGSVEIFAAQPEVGVTGNPVRLANLSTRGRVTAESPLILGFAIVGSESRPVLVRAIGPALTAFGVSDALAATRLQVYNAAGAPVMANEGWGGAANLAQAAAATGAFPLAASSADSAALLTLAPGNYTVQVLDPRGSGGVALAEIYDAGTGTGARLVNVSSRGAAGTGSAALISGFVISGGNGAERVLLRGVGPGLTQFGTTGAVTDPSVALFDAEGRSLGTNDNWVSSLTNISAAALRAGAFALEPGSKDAAVLATLPAGAYTIQVTAGTTGTALLEIYEVQ